MRKIFVLFTCLLISSFAFCNPRFNFYIEFSDFSNVPTVINNNDGTINLTTTNNDINIIYSNYDIYSFEQIAPFAINLNLQKTYSIECNDIQLMYDLKNNFPSIYLKVEQYSAPQPLFTPNDFVLNSPAVGTFCDARYLDRINAREAWDITHGSPNMIIGIIEAGLNINHEELANKVIFSTGFNSSHGSAVAGLAAGDTNNGVGYSSIGFDCKMAQGSIAQTVNAGARILNLSYGFGYIPHKSSPINYPYQTEQDLFNDLNNQDIVVIAAAGNGVEGNTSPYTLLNNGLALNAENFSSTRHYPASYKNVISVSTVGNWEQAYTTALPYDNWIDVHKVRKPQGLFYYGTNIPVTETEIFHQHNDSVDIVVPSYRVPRVGSQTFNTYWDSHDTGLWSGTSLSAPIVCGTVGLMLSENNCLRAKEVESVLKLTAVNIENLYDNNIFYGRLGAGRLDAYEAVKMAHEMNQPIGTVKVSDRILYRWFYVLENSPYKIEMQNNLVTDGAKIKFTARNNIDVLSGDYKPSSEGYVLLNVVNDDYSSCQLQNLNTKNSSINKDKNINNSNLETILYPNPNDGRFSLNFNFEPTSQVNISVYDISGKEVFNDSTSSKIHILDLKKLTSGIYYVKISSNELNQTLKFIKK